MTPLMHLMQVKGPAAAGPQTLVLRKHVAPQYSQVIIWPLLMLSCTFHQFNALLLAAACPSGRHLHAVQQLPAQER